MPTTQLILHLAAAPPALARLTRLLADGGVEIAGVWAVPCAPNGAFAGLAEGERPGLAHTASQLAEAGINTIVAYATGECTRTVAVVVDASDAARAAAALQRS